MCPGPPDLGANPDHQHQILRRELGEASRDYVMRYHSYDAAGRDWASIVGFAWSGEALPDHFAVVDGGS